MDGCHNMRQFSTIRALPYVSRGERGGMGVSSDGVKPFTQPGGIVYTTSLSRQPQGYEEGA